MSEARRNDKAIAKTVIATLQEVSRIYIPCNDRTYYIHLRSFTEWKFIDYRILILTPLTTVKLRTH